MQEMGGIYLYLQTSREQARQESRANKVSLQLQLWIDQTSTVVHIKTNLTLFYPILKSSRVQEEV